MCGAILGSTSLRTLVLDENRIRQLPDSLFLRLNALFTLKLRDNEISDVYSNSFTGLVGLRELDLSENKIPRLPLGIFDPLGLLRTLSLANNDIRHVDQMPFQSCRDLLTLDMSNNLLSSIRDDWFVTTTRLTSLKLSHNRIEDIQAGSFDRLRQLEELDLSENYLSNFRNNTFANCRPLQKLNLARNPIRKLTSPGITFAGLTALRELDLRGSCITTLVLNSSAPLPALTELYLGDNLLTEIDRQSLAAASNLQVLDLANNNIESIEAGALSSLTSLNSLDLSRNFLTENQLAAILQSIPFNIVVDVSVNLLKSIEPLTTPIRGIRLSGNPLDCSCTPLSWISLTDSSRLLDASQTLCYTGSEPLYLLCYWSRCDQSTDHLLCSEPFPPGSGSMVTLVPKTCRLDAALTVFGPRFVKFDARALSNTSAQLSWNISDEFNTVAGFEFTFYAVDNCTNVSATIFLDTLNQTGYTNYTTVSVSDVTLTTIDVENLIPDILYVICAQALQTLTDGSNRTSVSDRQCLCLELSEQTTTALPSTTTTTTEMQTTAPTTNTTTTTPTTTTATTTTTTTTLTTTIPPTTPPITNSTITTQGTSGLFLVIVIAVPTACLLLVLITICISLTLRDRRRRRRHKRPVEAEMTSSSAYDSSTVNCGRNGGFNSPLSEQATTTLTMNVYDGFVP